jgi:hypothetical protein
VQKSVRYYIVKTEDQPVVRSVPVTLAGAARPAPPADPEPINASLGAAPGRPLSGVARLMRSAIRRNEPRQ